MAERSWLLFDLGGVLIETTTFESLAALLPAPMDTVRLQDRWMRSDAVHRFERGEIDPGTFARLFIAEWDLRLTPEAFLARFAEWPRGPYPGVPDLLSALRPHHGIAILSNCNEIHWPRLAGVAGLADRAFSSHHLGLTKPDPEIFARVIGELGCPASDIRFFDDSPGNVDAARRAGMEADHVRGFDALRERIGALGLLPGPASR